YFLRSVTFAGVNLLTDSFTVSDKESSELQVGFGTTSPNPWSSVSGRVVGFDSGTGPFRVALEGDATSAIETRVNSDGTFEFARVLRNSRYIAKVRPENKVASTPRVTVAAKDVANVEIVVPREQEVFGRAVVEGGGPVPNFMLSLTAPSTIVTVLVKPDASGMFRIKLPEDERDVELMSLPFGYTLKSLAYGDTDLRACVRGAPPRCSYPKLKIAGITATELQIRLAVDPSIPFGKISGHVSGLSSDVGDVRLVFSDPSSFNVFEETVGADGSFAFLSLPQGTYVPTLTGGVQSGLMKPSIITVEGVIATGVDIEFPGGSAKREVATSADVPAGARVSEVGLSNRGAANEAAVVANLRTMMTAEVTYLSTSGGKWGSLPQMIEAGLLPDNFASGPVSGFRFGLVRDSENFVLAAIPDDSSAAQNGFYIVPDGVVRYSTIESLAPIGQNGLPLSH
ncbi:MAG TPA: hypothetical protein VK210_04225, partial [Terriglobia bacterium]|nr:hypothetical protein [Terriglobia bacterium]